MRKPLIFAGLLACSAVALAQASVSGLLPPVDPAAFVAMQLQSSQAALRTLDASGNDTWTFPSGFASAPRIAYFPQNADVTGKPIVCNWQTLTATSVTYHCDKSSGAITALLQNAFNNAGAAGAQISVYARGTLAVAP